MERLASYSRKRELLDNVIAVYIITVLIIIKTSAKFESHYNLLAVSCYLDHLFSASFKMQVLAFEAVYCSYCLFIFTLFQTVQRHGVYIAAYDMQLLLLLYYIVPICTYGCPGSK